MGFRGRSRRRESRFDAGIAFFGGLAMLGIFIALYVGDTGLLLFFFGVFFVGMIILNLIRSFINMTSDRGIAFEESDYEFRQEQPQEPKPEQRPHRRIRFNLVSRLRQLRKLKREGLITPEEYSEQRKRILNEG